jgi:hypothetical protein
MVDRHLQIHLVQLRFLLRHTSLNSSAVLQPFCSTNVSSENVMSFVTERRFETADGLEGSTNLGRVSEASNIIIIHRTSFRGVSTP